MNPKEGLVKASELIKQKRYKEAKNILVLIDHPKAEAWLNRIHEIEADDPFRQPAAKPNRGWGRAACGIFLVFVLLSMVIFTVASVRQSSERARDRIEQIEDEIEMEATTRAMYGN